MNTAKGHFPQCDGHRRFHQVAQPQKQRTPNGHADAHGNAHPVVNSIAKATPKVAQFR